MAANRHRGTTAYSTYGNVAYAPAYSGSAARQPRREEELRRAPEPRRWSPIRRKERARVQVRQPGAVAPFAVAGFLAVAVFALMLITSYAQLTVANDEMASLRRDLDQLKSENITLTAQYEKVFDLDTLQETVGDTMSRPTGDQVVYIDLSAPDTVTVYQEGGSSGLRSILNGVSEVFGDIIEYFR